MKLYYSPGACSLAQHIVLQELGLPHDLERVDLKTHKTESGKDFYSITPKGYVPVIERDGDILTEGAPLLLYLASLKPEKKLAVQPGEQGYFKQLEWLTYISSELHKVIGAAAFAALDDAGKKFFRERGEKRLTYLDAHFAKHHYLLGEQFTVADAYLFTVLNWTKPAQIDLAKWKNVAAFHARAGARPAVQAAMKAEGIQSAKAA